MEKEEKLIPYHVTDLTGKKVLVLAPHPDDETIGCGGSLAIHVKAGDPVKVVFLTNGAQGDVSGEWDRDGYVNMRQNEAEKACARLGVSDLEFWGYEDRALAGSRGALRRLIDLLVDFRPELVYAPSPLEFHPDHRAACLLLCDALHSYPPDLDVAFYEIGQPVRVNVLVDISGVSEQKARAVGAYRSQLKERPYADISLALDRYRSLTLEKDVAYAEGFSVWRSDIIRKIGPYAIPFQQAERLLPGPGEAGPLVSVIVRTKNRPALLANALTSIARQTYANVEIVMVNDGGEEVRDVAAAAAGGIPVTYIAHETSKGRAAAANAGLKAARGEYLNFLDDDDILYPDHLQTLVSQIRANHGKVAYSGVKNVYFHGPPEIPQNRVKEEVVFNAGFDPDRLLFENYIPAMSVLFSREALSWVEGFSEALDLFEDWDFWVRISRHTAFQHVEKITAEYRFYGDRDMERAHRNKYAYDQALSAVFERNLPFIHGNAWVRFL
ncbi:MAG: PIG-L family deacetylase, partial [Thermodesulfobacteriota bacterium]